MPSPLLTRDGRYLATRLQPTWLRRLLTWSIPLAALAVLSANAIGSPAPVCTDGVPCGADPYSSILIGVFLASALTGFVHTRTATVLAAVFAAGAIGYDLVHPQAASAWWVDALLIGYVVLCGAVARALRPRRAHEVAFDWLARTPYATPPAPARLPGAGRRTALLAGLAIAAAGLLVGWGMHAQARADAREQAAAVITAEVVEQVNEYALRVRLPDGRTVELDMLDTADHPVGSQLGLRVDAQGLRQPVDEEYDASGWYIPAVVIVGLLIAIVARARQRRLGLRRLFHEAQPVSAVYVCETWDRLAVYPADARPGEPAVAEIRLWRPPDEAPPASLLADEPVDDDVTLPELRPALLYGVPAPGQWSTVAVDGAVRMPRQPLRAHFAAPPFVPPGMSTDEPTGVDLPLRPEELAALPDTDRDDDPLVIRRHAGHVALGHARIVALALGLVTLSRLLPALSFPVTLVVCAAAVALAAEIGWRLWLRPRVSWNGGGMAVIALLRARRLTWPEIRHIAAERGAVIIASEDTALIVPATGGPSWPGPSRPRTAHQLALALRYARQRALASGAADLMTPPPLAVPRRPGSLAGLVLSLTPLFAVLLYLLR